MELKPEKITQYISAIFLVVVNGDFKKLQDIVFIVVFRPCMFSCLSVVHQR